LRLEALETRTMPAGLAGAAPLPVLPSAAQTAQIVGDGLKVGADLAVTAIDMVVLFGGEGVSTVFSVISAARTATSFVTDFTHGVEDMVNGNFSQAETDFGHAAIDFGGVIAKAAAAPLLAVLSDLDTLQQDFRNALNDVAGVPRPSQPATNATPQPTPPRPPANLGPLISIGGSLGYDPDNDNDLDVNQWGDPTDGDGVPYAFRTAPFTPSDHP
jgi:hypothetical protein